MDKIVSFLDSFGPKKLIKATHLDPRIASHSQKVKFLFYSTAPFIGTSPSILL